jgi:transcriptional regulator of aromatic amino acid metabolism
MAGAFLGPHPREAIPLGVGKRRQVIADVEQCQHSRMLLLSSRSRAATRERAEPPTLGPSAMAALQAHGWPGNVPELRNVIERAMAYSPVPSELRAEHLRISSA